MVTAGCVSFRLSRSMPPTIVRGMVISHQNKYLYIQVPHSASTAIAAEFCAYYGGEPILSQHATYADFLYRSSPEEQTYRVIASLRHPMDVALTQYTKLKNDHKQRYSTPSVWQQNNRIGRKELKRFAAVRREDMCFESYLRRYHRGIYNDYAASLPDALFRLIRYDRLQDDFRDTVLALGMEPVRALPRVNTTEGKPGDWASAYPASLRVNVQRHFGPYMEKWGFAFPPDWSPRKPTSLEQARFQCDQFLRRAYYAMRAHPLWLGRRHLRPRVPFEK